MRNIQVVQPIIPHYRVPFFAALAMRKDIDICLHASDSVPGDTGLQPAVLPSNIPLTLHRCVPFFGNRLLWQSDISLDRHLRSGDVIVLNGNPRFLSNFPLFLAAKRCRIGVVWWGHGWSAGSNPFTARVRRVLMRLADVLLLYMEQEVDQLIRLGFPADRVFAINNTIDQESVRLAAGLWDRARLARFRDAHGLSRRKLLLFCGRLSTKARLELGIEALQRLTRHDDYVLAIIGEGGVGETLHRLSAELGVSERIRWLGPMIEQSDLAPWFLAADCFVYPGAIGLSLMHAFAYGLPVVTHGNLARQMPEARAVQHCKNGYLFLEDNVASLVEGIRFVCDDSERQRFMSECALQTGRRYSIGNMVENFVRAASVASKVATLSRE